MGIFIFFLARFMRGGIEKTSEPSGIDRALALIGKGISAVAALFCCRWIGCWVYATM